MYDVDTASLIRSAPELDGLDRERLPEQFTLAFAKISAARVRLREQADKDTHEVSAILEDMQRLAYTNEAFTAFEPERENRNASAFVAATAHQLCINANSLISDEPSYSFLNGDSISNDISATLLFMVSESLADAAEAAKRLHVQSKDKLTTGVIDSLRDLASGKLVELIERPIPDRQIIMSEDPFTSSVRALYLSILEGIHMLAEQMLTGGQKEESQQPEEFFKQICDLCIGPDQSINRDWFDTAISHFSGPHHLAKLLSLVSRDLTDNAVSKVPSPPGIDSGAWTASMISFARRRPYIWSNHRLAIERKYLHSGVSAVVGFPTGAGKSTLSELKINAALLTGKDVIFVAPTHALVGQTAKALSETFPTSRVRKERVDEFGFLSGEQELPEIFVMTPESCLTQMSVDKDVFENVGLFVFDECHLMHSEGRLPDRRAVDSMLCVLNIVQIQPELDLLLLSAMMKNTDDIAGWISELILRDCLSLATPWKPTRQLRGSVVYQHERMNQLKVALTESRKDAKTKHPSASIKRQLTAKPYAFFSLQQTWASSNRRDYALARLMDSNVVLGANQFWRLTPNAVAVSSNIAVAASESGVKTLVFFQTIKNASSAAKKISDMLGNVDIELKKDEAGWLGQAVAELGHERFLYIDTDGVRVKAPATVHHGLLLPSERLLCESLYKRADGIKLLTATSTLAQGMNLPSELVIIGEDSRFDVARDRREILAAQELLNAAGRAGRAGESASGIVLVVPGKVVGFDDGASTIDAHWTVLREIFGQSDQCLEIDDPLTAILDRLHSGTESIEEIDRYAIFRLASAGGEKDDVAPLKESLRASLGAFMARKRSDEDWVSERVKASILFYEEQCPKTDKENIESDIAAILGLSNDLVFRLSSSLKKRGPNVRSIVSHWSRWFFWWLGKNPDLVEQAFRRSTLVDLFGKGYCDLETNEAKAAFILPILSQVLNGWMRGISMCILERLLLTDSEKVDKCVRARKFVLRLIPEIAYLFGLPALLHERAQVDEADPQPLHAAVQALSRCVRFGFDTHEKAALNDIMRNEALSRRQIHIHFSSVRSYLTPANQAEDWSKTLDRVTKAHREALKS